MRGIRKSYLHLLAAKSGRFKIANVGLPGSGQFLDRVSVFLYVILNKNIAVRDIRES
jgi:hypothetical protein